MNYHIKIRRYLIFGIIVVLSVGARWSDAFAATIQGWVTAAESGEALPYVSILVQGRTPPGGIVKRGLASDEEGRFGFTDLPAGRYTLRFIYIGYEEHIEELELQSAQTIDLDITLTVEPIEVDEIIVEADRFRTEREVQPSFVSLDAEVLADIPGIVESDPIRSMQLLPGVQTASDISSGLYVRGGGPDQTLVLLDQVPVYNPTHALGFFSTFNADAVDDVTLYKGAYPAQHGGRLGAVLDVSSRDPGTPKFSGKGGVSTIAARLTAEGPLGGNHWLIGGRRTYLDPLLSVIRSEENPVPSYYFYDLNAKFMTKRDNDWIVASGYRGRDNIGFDFDEDGTFDIIWGNSLLSASYNRMVTPTLLGKIQVSGSEYVNDMKGGFFGTTFDLENQLRDFTTRVDLDWYGPEKHRVRGGVQASAYDFSYKQVFNKEDPVRFGTRPYEFSLYADDQWKPRTGTALRGGLRTRFFSDGERVLLEPRLSASQMLNGSVRVKLGAGIYNQFLQLVTTEGFSFADFYVPIDETANGGQSRQIVLGAEWFPTRRYQFSLEGYYTDLKDLVILNNQAPSDQESFDTVDIFHTGGTGYATGIEVFAERRTGNLTGWIGYTLGWTRRTFEQINQGLEYAPKYDRRHDLKVVASYRRGKWTYGSVFIYATGQAFTPAAARYGLRDPATEIVPEGGRVLPADKNSARLLPYNRLDLSMARDFKLFGSDAQWFVQVFNVYSRRNEWFVQYGEEDGAVKVSVAKMLPIIPSVGLNFTF